MFVVLKQVRFSNEPDADMFSYKLVKNPASVYERSSGARKVFGKYIDSHSYAVSVINDPVSFIETARDLNMASYVHTQLSAVAPFNLLMVANAFRSVLAGKYQDTQMTEDQFFVPGGYSACLGPFAVGFEQIQKMYQSLGLQVEDVTANNWPDVKNSVVVELSTVNDCSLTEFVQKLYVGANALTAKQVMSYVNDEQVLKLARLSSAWLDRVDNRGWVIQRLFNYNKKHIALYDKAVAEMAVVDDEVMKSDRVEDVESVKTPGLHKLRHETIIGCIGDNVKTVVELGCGGGKFAWALHSAMPEIDYVGMDYFIRYAKNGKSGKVDFLEGDISCPRDHEKLVGTDLLVCTEVLEHNHKSKRDKILDMISRFYVPKTVIITVPNLEYNSVYGLEEGEFRHKDHKIEYTRQDFNDEVVKALSKNYDVEYIDIKGYENLDQPSWAIVCTWKHKEEFRVSDKRMKDEITSFYSDIYLPNTGYTIRTKEIVNGSTEVGVRENGENIFCIAPTIPPCDYMPGLDSPVLEHPRYAFEYYRKRGITTLYEEQKHMGSHVYILLCGSMVVADYFGVDRLVTINSRNGHQAFANRPDLLRALAEIAMTRLGPNEAIAFSAEAMPWNLFAEKLIEKEFRTPGECALITRAFSQFTFADQIKDSKTINAASFLDALNCFDTPEQDAHFQAFNLIFKAELKPRRNSDKVDVSARYGAFMHRDDIYAELAKVCDEGSVLRLTPYDVVDLTDEESMSASIRRWESYCRSGEGFVYKLPVATKQDVNGYYFQPMMKVRGKDYLRLIYGIDYLEEDCFNVVKKRGTTKKRKLAVQQHELSINLVSAFVSKHRQHKKFVSAFMGMENVAKAKIDSTL